MCHVLICFVSSVWERNGSSFEKKKRIGQLCFFQNSLLSSLGKGCGHTIFPRIVESLKWFYSTNITTDKFQAEKLSSALWLRWTENWKHGNMNVDGYAEGQYEINWNFSYTNYEQSLYHVKYHVKCLKFEKITNICSSNSNLYHHQYWSVQRIRWFKNIYFDVPDRRNNAVPVQSWCWPVSF